MIKSIVKNLMAFIAVGFFVFIVYNSRDSISLFLDEFFFPREEVVVKAANQYTRNYVYESYKLTTDFDPENREDLLNIYYTVLNSGWDTFFFYCSKEYANCLNDVSSIIKDETLLSSINNYVNPYNSYLTIETLMDNYGKVTITPEYVYSRDDISIINQKLDAMIANAIKPTMNTQNKIRAIHDYIINNTVYDSEMVKTGINNHRANTAVGPLVNGYSICGGYSDSMALFLDRIGIPNYKVASVNHVWNYLYIDNGWYHLDLTWDDPLTASGASKLIYTYFLITDAQLTALNTSGNHTFDTKLY